MTSAFEERQAAFEKFHRENPILYAELVRLAREAKAAGAERLGIRQLWERLRWWLRFEVKRDGDYGLNDHLTAHYSRLIMDREPDLANFFETRGDKPKATEPEPIPYVTPEQESLFSASPESSADTQNQENA